MAAKKKDDRSIEALEAVARLFAQNPKASTGEFRTVAEKADSGIQKLSPRSFNAKYVLPLKRSAAAAPGKGKTAAKKAAERITAKAKGEPVRRRSRRRSTKAGGKKPRRMRRVKTTEDISPADVTKLRELVAKRDQEVMAAAQDPEAAYSLARSVDDFVQQMLKVVR